MPTRRRSVTDPLARALRKRLKTRKQMGIMVDNLIDGMSNPDKHIRMKYLDAVMDRAYGRPGTNSTVVSQATPPQKIVFEVEFVAAAKKDSTA